MSTSKLLLLIVVIIGGCTSSNDKNEPGFEALKKKAKKNYDRDNYKEAFACYDSLIKIDSTVGEFYFNKGNTEIALNMHDRAREDFFKSIKLGYKVASSYYNIGLTHLYLNDSLTRKYMNECLKLNPNHEKAKMVLYSLEVLK